MDGKPVAETKTKVNLKPEILKYWNLKYKELGGEMKSLNQRKQLQTFTLKLETSKSYSLLVKLM